MSDAIKFPKTPRLSEILSRDVYTIWGQHRAVVEEKVDGANVGIWFAGDRMLLQSRGHVLRGGPGEAQFAPFHTWAAARYRQLHDVLGENLILYGEWCFAKNRAFYDALPDWFLGFDLGERGSQRFLPSDARNRVFQQCGIHAVPELWAGRFIKAPPFASFIGKSRLKTADWRSAFEQEARRSGVRDAMNATDNSDDMEGVYVRVESSEEVVARFKVHREGFDKVRNDNWKRTPLIRQRCKL